MKLYFRVLALFYLLGGFLHLLDLFDLRLVFSEMSSTWQLWIVYLTIADLVTAIGLWLNKKFGLYGFFLVAGSQLIAYIGFQEQFGNQVSLIVFHVLTLIIYFVLKFKNSSSAA